MNGEKKKEKYFIRLLNDKFRKRTFLSSTNVERMRAFHFANDDVFMAMEGNTKKSNF